MKKTASLAVLAILLKNGFESYFIGSKSRNDLHNKLFPDEKIPTEDYHIFTNANQQDVTNIFVNSECKNDILNTVVISFGGFNFEVSTCNTKKDFMDERDKRDITINTIAQDIEGKYIDYEYTYRNQKISAIKDLKSKKIRSVGNPYQRFAADPSRIVRIFRIMAQTGYEIEKSTLRAAEMHLGLLKNITTMQIGEDINKLIIGKAAPQAILKMLEIGFFNAEIYNPFLEKHVTILPMFQNLQPKQLVKLLKYNNYRYFKDGYNRILDCWSVLLNEFNIDEAMDNLCEIHPVSFDDIEKIRWMLKHYEIVHSKNIKQDFLDAKENLNGFFVFHELINKLVKINNVINGIDAHEESKQVLFHLCSRPYFKEQISGGIIKEIAKINDGELLEQVKEQMIPKIVLSSVYPNEQEYKKIILESVGEVLC